MQDFIYFSVLIMQYKESLTSTTTTTTSTPATTTTAKAPTLKKYSAVPTKKYSKYSNRFSPTIRPFKKHKFGNSRLITATPPKKTKERVMLKTTTTIPLMRDTSSAYRQVICNVRCIIIKHELKSKKITRHAVVLKIDAQDVAMFTFQYGAVDNETKQFDFIF